MSTPTLQKTCSVQQKISCLFDTVVIEEVSPKRAHQPFRVVASDTIKDAAIQADIEHSVATEKLDGTCVYVGYFNGKPWLWPRLDRKPNKSAEKRLKKHQAQKRQWEIAGKPEGFDGSDVFQWDVEKDFKEVPETWIPAQGVGITAGLPQPDNNGHIPGWVPVDSKSRQYCWHLSTVHLDAGLAIVLKTQKETNALEITIEHLDTLNDKTLELIGTNVNGNPYHIGAKQQPIHFLTIHGGLILEPPPPLEFCGLKRWFEEESGAVEGIVWHCKNGSLFKVHRHHIQLPWPVPQPKLSISPVTVNVDLTKFPDVDFTEHVLFRGLNNVNGLRFERLSLLNLMRNEVNV